MDHSGARRWWAVAAATTLLAAGIATVQVPLASAASTNQVLILSDTVTGGTASIEAQEVSALGLVPVVVDAAGWSALSATQFASYRALILGDATCSSTIPQAAVDNAATWGVAVTGNQIINGTDPVFHASVGSPGGDVLTRRSLDFAVADATKTGLYLSLSCYYHGVAAATPVPLLSGLAPTGFSVTGVGCYNSAHIVATHPALTGLTDTDLSNWSCSVHEAFDAWPPSYTVLGIALDFGAAFTAADGTVGTPYILARGAGLRTFPLSLDPTSQTAATGSSATMTAQLLDGATSKPLAGTALRFRVASGPNAGTAGACTPANCVTDTAGHVGFRYPGAHTGTDVVQVWLDTTPDGVPGSGEPQTSAAVTWTAPSAAGYAALGDSYSSGEGNPPFDAGTYVRPDTCDRSAQAWPKLLSTIDQSLNPFTNFACSGATTPAITTDTFKTELPQISQLKTATGGAPPKLITITVGGDDIGFAPVLRDCYLYGQCQGDIAKATDAVQHSLPTKLLTTFSALRTAFPGSRIVVVGYPMIFPAQYTRSAAFRCWWLSRQMLTGLNKVGTLLETAERTAAANAKVEFVSVFGAVAGHELCTADSWIRAIGANNRQYSAHPLPKGQLAIAQAVESYLHQIA